MKEILFVFLLVRSIAFGQIGPISVPSLPSEFVKFHVDTTEPRRLVGFVNPKLEADTYCSLRILDSITRIKACQVYTSQGQLIFDFKGKGSSGKFKKYYANGKLLAEGQVHRGKLSGRYKEYATTGDLVLDCFYRDNKIVLKNKVFFRRDADEILCDKEKNEPIDYEHCAYFTSTPNFMRLLKTSDNTF